jgi:hypothetical protein
MIDGQDGITMAVHAAANWRKAVGSRDELESNRAVRANAYAELANRLVSAGSGEKLIEVVSGVILEAVVEECRLVETQCWKDCEQKCVAFQGGVLAAVERVVKGIRP